MYFLKVTALCMLLQVFLYVILALNYEVIMKYYGELSSSTGLKREKSIMRMIRRNIETTTEIVMKSETEETTTTVEAVNQKPYALDTLDIDCEGMMRNATNTTTEAELVNIMKKSKFYEQIEHSIWNATDRCSKLNEIFKFRKTPLSDEEAEYPIAYGILAYKDLVQVLFMLSSFYHPQNQYCIGVSANAGAYYTDLLQSFTNCFPNVHFMARPAMRWGSHEIINSLYTILEFLTHLKSDWKYFQYLSGYDIPLKTNLEMVRIFKALNGTPNMEIVPHPYHLLRGKKMSDSPIPLFKSSMSALVPRHVANFMSTSTIPRDLLCFLHNTSVPDESFWGSLFANKDLFNFPNAINGTEWLKFQGSINTNKSLGLLKFGHPLKYYVSRFQSWSKAGVYPCNGHNRLGSCVFSVLDLPFLMETKPLVAHKVYLGRYPAAFFCALKKIQDRSENPSAYPTLNISFYENLPQVQMTRGIALENVTIDDLML